MASKSKVCPVDQGNNEGPKSSRRDMPIDIEIGERRLSPRDNHDNADKDYFGNFEKFKRTDNMAAPPTREGYGKKEQK